MGYTTTFEGRFNLDKPLTKEHSEYLQEFAKSRRMRRNESLTQGLEDRSRAAVGLLVGPEGCFYVGDADFGCVVDHNVPPTGQPGLWCQWVPSDDDQGIEWDGGEKFYNYTEWLKYLVKRFLAPWGYVLSGSVAWDGEDHSDRGTLVVRNNVVSTVTEQQKIETLNLQVKTQQAKKLGFESALREIFGTKEESNS